MQPRDVLCFVQSFVCLDDTTHVMGNFEGTHIETGSGAQCYVTVEAKACCLSRKPTTATI